MYLQEFSNFFYKAPDSKYFMSMNYTAALQLLDSVSVAWK